MTSVSEDTIWVAQCKTTGLYTVVFGIIPDVAYVCMKKTKGDKGETSFSFTVTGMTIESLKFLTPPELEEALKADSTLTYAFAAAEQTPLCDVDPRAIAIDFSFQCTDHTATHMIHGQRDEDGNETVERETQL
jgi:hypothetical protein